MGRLLVGPNHPAPLGARARAARGKKGILGGRRTICHHQAMASAGAPGGVRACVRFHVSANQPDQPPPAGPGTDQSPWRDCVYSFAGPGAKSWLMVIFKLIQCVCVACV